MSHQHQFLFSKGVWIGEGKISFSFTQDHLNFYTKWIIDPMIAGTINIQHRVEMHGFNENVYNHFMIFDIHNDRFQIELQNGIVGKVIGKGVIDDKTIAWEFRGYDHFEGFEVWELQGNGDYMLHSEYFTEDQFRTNVEGRIWMKQD